MTIIDTTLYANGALRLSRHGAGRGDTVLQRTDATGFAFTVPDAMTEGLANNLEALLEENRPIQHIWDDLIELYVDNITEYAPH